MKNRIAGRRSPGPIALALLIVAVMPLSAFAQGSIFGTVQNSDLSTPANGNISFFGFLDDTDEEVRIETSTGAGFDAGNWFDDFQNYLTEAPGNPYDYYFYNVSNDEGSHLGKLIPSNSFQQENILLAAVSWPFKPSGLAATVASANSVVIDWNSAPGMTYHVYRRGATSNGSFFRIDDPTGALSNSGVADSFYVDATVNGVSSYDYMIIAEDASGNFSQHSDIITANSSLVVAPSVASIVPDSGLSLGGTAVTIHGSGFDMAGAGALVGTALTGITVVSPHEITGLTQPGAAGPVNVSVTNLASGQVSDVLVGGFTYISNSPPVLAAIGPQGGIEGTPITFTATATDADGGFPVLTSTTLPPGATYVDNGDGTASFDWTPTFFDDGVYNVTFYATDNLQPTLVDSEQVVITVVEAGNQLPVLAAIGPQGGTESVLLSFSATASDIESTPVLTTSTLPPGAGFVDNGDGSGDFNWTPGFTDAGIYNVTFYATDDSAAVDSEQVVITINELGNQSPVLAAIGPQTGTENVNLNFGVTATDPDATTPTLTTSTLPTGASFLDNGNGSGVFDWTPGFTDAGIYNVTFYADDGALIDSEQVVITINDAGNQSPVLAAIGPQTGTENINLNFGVTATDPDATIPTLTTSTLPTGASFLDNGDGSGIFDWTPGFTDAGIYNVTFYADDGALIDSEQVVITINDAGNQSPLLAAIGPQTGTESINLNFGVTATDPDATIPTLTTSTLPTGASFLDNGDGSGVFDWTPGFTDAGIYNVTFYADDGALIDSEQVVITVADAGNQSPVLAAIGPQTTVEDLNLNFTVNATDPDAEIPTLSTSTLPAGATFLDNGDGSGVFDWTPGFTDAGQYNVTFYASDGALIDSEQVIIDVIDAENQLPILAPIGPQTTDENVNLNFAVSATDPDATIPALSTSTLPTGATFIDNGDGSAVFDWTPDFTQAGIHNITFYADDGALQDSEIVIITVNEVGNQPPLLAPIGPQLIAEGANLNFVVTASDPDGTFPVLSNSVLPTGATYVDNGDGTAVFDWTPDFTQGGAYNVTFYADDGVAPADSEVVTFTVTDAGNQTPSLVAIGPQSVTEGLSLNFVVAATDPDPQIPILSTSTLPTGATFADSGDGSGVFDWTPDYTQAGVYYVTFYADDGALIDSEQVEITVTESGNHAAVLDSIGDKAGFEGTLLVFPVTASDSDGTIPTLSTSALPTGATFTDNLDGMGVFQWTPDFQQSGSYNVTFYADDGVAAADSEAITITVSESGDQPPVITPIPDTSVSEGDTLRVVIHASDPEGGFVSLSAYTTMPRTSFVDSGNGTGVLTYRPNYYDAGIDTVRIFASEVAPPYQASLATFVITTIETNQGPVFKPAGPFSVEVGDSLTFRVTASDTTDADTTHVLYLSALSMPSNATFVDYGNDTGRFTFHPDFGQEGVDTVTFRAVDQGPPQLSTTMEVEITVLPTNVPPVITPIGPQLVLEGATLVINITATDPDGALPVSLSVDTLPDNATFADHLDGTGTLTFSPSFLQAGLYHVTFMADDGFDVTEELVLIQVREAGNQAPVWDPIPGFSVTEGLTLTDSVTAQDPELVSITYDVDTLTVPANFTFVDSGNGVAWFTFTPDYRQAGSYNITIIASDGDQTTPATLSINVLEAGNQPPELSELSSSVSVSELATVSFPVAAFDVDGPPPVMTSSTLPGTATFTDPEADDVWTFAWTTSQDDSGSYSVWFYATDAVFPADVDSAEVIITVNDVNRTPWFLIPFNQPDSVTELDTLLYSIQAWDDDLSQPEIILSVNGTGGLLPNMTFDVTWDGQFQNGLLTFVPDYSQGDGNPTLTYLKFYVVDEFDIGLIDSSSTKTIKVYDRNQPPIINFSDSTWPIVVTEGQNVNFNVQALDDRDVPPLRAEGLPDSNYTVTKPATNAIIFDFTPDFTQGGQYFISFIADDYDGASDTATVEILVTEAGNQPPVWSVTLADTIDVFLGFPWIQVLTATDPEATPVTLDATPVVSNATWDTTGGVGTYYFAPDFSQDGLIFPITFTATDSNGLSSIMVTNLNVQSVLRGDVDGNKKYTLNDVVVLAGYIFRGGLAPNPMDAGDADLSGTVDVADIVYMINFLYHAGPRPPQ